MNIKLLLPTLLLAAPLAFAQGGPGMSPPSMDHSSRMSDNHHRGMSGGFERGMWWKSPEVAARIGLSPEQQKKIEDIVLQSRVQLIDLHASLEKEQLLMEPLLNANPVDQPKAMAQIDKIADTRATLEKTNAKMLLSIRGVLTADQWTKLQAGHHQMRRGSDGPGRRGPGFSGRDSQRGSQQKNAAPTPPASAQ